MEREYLDDDPTGYQDAQAEFARDLELEELAEVEGDTTMMSD